MDEDDARRLTPEEQHERRRQVIRAFKRGVNKRQIARDLGLSYPGTCQIIARYQTGGMKALAPRKRGRREGHKRMLSADQEGHIRKLICDKRPEQLKMEFALWSRVGVGQLIENEFEIKVPVRTVGQYLKRWGFTPQKPIQRAYEQSPQKVKAWLEQEYPVIHERAKAEGAEIHWGDQSALVNTDVRGRSYAPCGKTPVIKVVGGTRKKLSMLSTVTNQGKTRWQIIDGNFNHEKLIEFFEALIQDTDRKLFVMLDNLGVHHCKPVKGWLKEHEDEIEVFYLPSYSPELNPDERLNADLKQAMGSKVPARTKPKFEAAATAHMEKLETGPHRVKVYFQDPRVQYVAQYCLIAGSIIRILASVNVLWFVTILLILTGCAMHGTWYRPQASEGEAENRLCYTAGRNNEWVLKRQDVEFRIAVLPGEKHDKASVQVYVFVPAGSDVHLLLNNLRVYGPSGQALKVDFGDKVYVSGGYITHDGAGNHVHNLHYALHSTIGKLNGDRAASKTFPYTDYGFWFTVQEKPPSTFDILLPKMKINGHKYPALKIHFTKTTGTYFVITFNC